MSADTQHGDEQHRIEREELPSALVRTRRVSALWVIPLLAIILVGTVIVQQAAKVRGPTITISFDDAKGIEPGSHVVHRGIRVGVVRDVTLASDLEHADVIVELDPRASALAVDGSSFWVVRAQLSLQRVSGLDTLVGPNYIAVRPGASGGTPARVFDGLDGPPLIDRDTLAAKRVTLETDRLGTLTPGSPVLYREIRVGSVRSARLDSDATRVLVEIHIDPRYAPLVRADSRFWRSGGVGVDFGLFTGLSVEADSLESVLSSSVSFATPESRHPEPMQSEQVFELADSPKDSWLEWSPRIPIEQ